MTDSRVHGEGRAEYLLDGRRVKVADLIEAGLIEPEASLIFARRLVGETHEATVRADGWIVLADGREFRSPSKAAAVAASARAFDGWHAWVLQDSGRSLDSYRQELLDEAAQEVERPFDRSVDDIRRARARHERLKAAKNRADADDPMHLSVRDLLEWWGASRRGSHVSRRIESDLANYGLVSVPSFLTVSLDSIVQIASLEDEIASLDAQDPGGTGSPMSIDGMDKVLGVPNVGAVDVDEPLRPAVGLTAGNLRAGLGPLASVSPQSTIDEAVTVMLLNDFSQLAVLSGERDLRGAVSWKSVAQARNANPRATLTDALVRVPDVLYNTELIDLLPLLRTSDFVFVLDRTKAVKGIVTTADVVDAYDELATPFMLLGALEQTLRALISAVFEIHEISNLCDPDGHRAPLSFDDLTMGDYQRILESPGCWTKLGWSLDRASFVARLNELREIRNDVMHFNPDPVPEDAVSMLRNLLGVLEQYWC